MKKHFTESYIICIDIINSLIQKIIGSEFLESFVKIKQIDDIEIDLGEIKKWTNEMMIAYSKLPKEYEKIGIEVADCLEERLRELCKGRDKMGNIMSRTNSYNFMLDKVNITHICNGTNNGSILITEVLIQRRSTKYNIIYRKILSRINKYLSGIWCNKKRTAITINGKIFQ